MSAAPTMSPAGAQRERSVSCQSCRVETWNHEALCTPCLERKAEVDRIKANVHRLATTGLVEL